MKQEYSVSVILPVIDETDSLNYTIEIIDRLCNVYIKEYMIVYCDRTTPEAVLNIANLKSKYYDKIVLLNQVTPGIGGAIREAFDICSGSHVIMMASDLETPPSTVFSLIIESINHNTSIITANRQTFYGYNIIKLISNFIFNKFFSILYKTDISDLTYGYRLFPSELVKSIKWEEEKHPFFLESILKPIKLDLDIRKINTVWSKRKEGKSSNSFFANFKYFKTGFKILFMKKENILK
jgi:hypothetical protein